MSKGFGDLLAAAAFFGKLGAEIQHGAEHGLEDAAKVVEEKAKQVLGTYEFGWPQLADSTIAKKATGNSPLLETGEMKESIQHVVEGKSAFVGSSSDIAVYQEHGTSKIPPRSFLVRSAIEKGPEIEAAIGHAVIKAIEGG